MKKIYEITLRIDSCNMYYKTYDVLVETIDEYRVSGSSWRTYISTGDVGRVINNIKGRQYEVFCTDPKDIEMFTQKLKDAYISELQEKIDLMENKIQKLKN